MRNRGHDLRHSTDVWAMADRRVFTETRKRARAFVRTKLGEGLQAGSTTAGVTGRIWSEVVGRIDRKLHTDMRRHTKPNQPAIGPQIPGQDVPRITSRAQISTHRERRAHLSTAQRYPISQYI